MRIGIIGYSSANFNKEIAQYLIQVAFAILEDQYPNERDITIISGLTYLGIPAIAYDFAREQGWKTEGIACAKAHSYDCFPVDNQIIVGTEWGDESETFLDAIDVLIRIGGGQQSFKELARAKEKGVTCFEFDLPVSK